MKLFLAFIFIYSSSIFAKPPQVECLLSISVSEVNFVQSEEDQSVAVTLNLIRENDDKKCKKYTLGISTGSSSSYNRKMYNGSESVEYNFYKDENTSKIIKDLVDGGDRDHVKIDFKKNNTKTITIFARMPNPYIGGVLVPGMYSDLVAVNIEASDKKAYGTSTANLSVNLNIQSDINISLVDKGQPYQDNRTNYALFYGVMIAGQTKGLHLIVKSNSGYRITLSSEGNGRMRHVNRPLNYVDYNFAVNGSNMSLIGSKNNPIEVFSSPMGAPQDGEIIDLDVTIQSVDNKLSGTYRDFIYINAISTH
jgi:spore coat protein U-like protein